MRTKSLDSCDFGLGLLSNITRAVRRAEGPAPPPLRQPLADGSLDVGEGIMGLGPEDHVVRAGRDVELTRDVLKHQFARFSLPGPPEGTCHASELWK